jgi:1-acyl-sn-glycerol-3-phosphate acyltransferase
MVRTIIWFVRFWVYQLRGLFYAMRLKAYDRRGDRQGRDEYLYSVVRTWAKAMVANSGSRVTVTGIENIPAEGSVLFVSNHQSDFDIPLMLGYLSKNKGFVAKVELENFPLLSRWMRETRCVFLDRKDLRKSIKTIREGAEILKSGHSLIIFPEGTRSRSPRTGEFKKGSLKMAVKANVPVVPVTINHSWKIMGTRGLIIAPADVELTVSPAIYPDKLTEDERQNLSDIVRGIITDKVKAE